MAGVFLSYDRDDVDKARPLALALEKAGHSVWWDLHVRGGAQFSKVIEEALKAADVVVVLVGPLRRFRMGPRRGCSGTR